MSTTPVEINAVQPTTPLELGPGEVLVTQSTFVDLQVTYDGVVLPARLQFTRALERTRIAGTFSRLTIHSQHPLCINHTEPWSYISIGSGPADSMVFLSELNRIVSQASQGWRRGKDYINPHFYAQPDRLTPDAMGVLINAPTSILAAAMEHIRANISLCKMFDSMHADESTPVAVTMDRMYLIARQFQFVCPFSGPIGKRSEKPRPQWTRR